MSGQKQPSTKEKLAAIVNGFDDFDSEMKIGTRVWSPVVTVFLPATSYQQPNLKHQYSLPFFQQRREQDEFKIADLKNTMMRLDSELIIEIKRRTEMNKSTQMVIFSFLMCQTFLWIVFAFLKSMSSMLLWPITDMISEFSVVVRAKYGGNWQAISYNFKRTNRGKIRRL